MIRSRLFTLGIVAGLADALTGLGLLAAPELISRLLGLGVDPSDAMWLRWIGAFVLAVGWATLVPALRGATSAQMRAQLGGAHRATATSRIAVALVLLWLVGRGDLPPIWLGVAGWDAAVAGLQHHTLRREGDHPC